VVLCDTCDDSDVILFAASGNVTMTIESSQIRVHNN